MTAAELRLIKTRPTSCYQNQRKIIFYNKQFQQMQIKFWKLNVKNISFCIISCKRNLNFISFCSLTFLPILFPITRLKRNLWLWLEWNMETSEGNIWVFFRTSKKKKTEMYWHLFTIIKNGVIIVISFLLQNTLAISQMAH